MIPSQSIDPKVTVTGVTKTYSIKDPAYFEDRVIKTVKQPPRTPLAPEVMYPDPRKIELFYSTLSLTKVNR